MPFNNSFIFFVCFRFYSFQVKIWFQNRRMKWRNSKERELLSTGGSREQTLPTKNNPNPDLSDPNPKNPNSMPPPPPPYGSVAAAAAARQFYGQFEHYGSFGQTHLENETNSGSDVSDRASDIDDTTMEMSDPEDDEEIRVEDDDEHEQRSNKSAPNNHQTTQQTVE